MGLLEKLFGKRAAAEIASKAVLENVLATPQPEEKKETKTEAKVEAKPKSDLLTYTVFVAWSNKYEGEKQILEDVASYEEPYGGLKGTELREEIEMFDYVYKYPIQDGYDVYFEEEPDNQYNPEAIVIMSREYGKLGYVPDKNLSRVRGILKKDKYDAKWIFTCREKKVLNEDDRIVTEGRNQSKLEVEFTYPRPK